MINKTNWKTEKWVGVKAVGTVMAMAPVLCEDLVVEILSWLPVKALMRFSCVSKTRKTLIFSPTFVKFQLQRASKNTHTLLSFLAFKRGDKLDMPAGATLCSNRSLLEDTSPTVVDCGFQYFDRAYFFVGSCNGLVCLLGRVFGEHWIRFLEPRQQGLCLMVHHAVMKLNAILSHMDLGTMIGVTLTR